MNFAKWLIYAGFGLVIVGSLIWILSKAGIPIGKLPGDFYIKGKNTSLYFPLTTSLLLSAILTFVISFVLYTIHKK